MFPNFGFNSMAFAYPSFGGGSYGGGYGGYSPSYNSYDASWGFNSFMPSFAPDYSCYMPQFSPAFNCFPQYAQPAYPAYPSYCPPAYYTGGDCAVGTPVGYENDGSTNGSCATTSEPQQQQQQQIQNITTNNYYGSRRTAAPRRRDIYVHVPAPAPAAPTVVNVPGANVNVSVPVNVSNQFNPSNVNNNNSSANNSNSNSNTNNNANNNNINIAGTPGPGPAPTSPTPVPPSPTPPPAPTPPAGRGAVGLVGDPDLEIYTPGLQTPDNTGMRFDLPVGAHKDVLADTDSQLRVGVTGARVSDGRTGVGQVDIDSHGQRVLLDNNGNIMVDGTNRGNINTAGTIGLNNGASIRVGSAADGPGGATGQRFIFNNGEYEVTAARRQPTGAGAYYDLNFEEKQDGAASHGASGDSVRVTHTNTDNRQENVDVPNLLRRRTTSR